MRPHRHDRLFDRIRNQKEIAIMVCRHFRSGSEAVTYRVNPFLDPAIVASARMLLRKPFLTSWSSFIPQQALTYEPVFEAFADCIFITTTAREAGHSYWDGMGNYLEYVKLANIASFSGPAQMAACGVLIQEAVYLEIRHLLEEPVPK